MYHGKHLKKLGRKTPKHRMDMLRNMVTSLVKFGRIETTWVRAKSMQRLADKMVSYIKDGSIHSENICKGFVREHEITIPKLKEMAQRFQDRPGGYTRVLKNGTRQGDNAPMGIIEYIGEKDDLRAFLVTRAEAQRRIEKEKDPKTSMTFQEIHEFLVSCQKKNITLPKNEFLRLKAQQKALRSFDRKIEKVKSVQNLDEASWEENVNREIEAITKKANSLKISA